MVDILYYVLASCIFKERETSTSPTQEHNTAPAKIVNNSTLTNYSLDTGLIHSLKQTFHDRPSPLQSSVSARCGSVPLNLEGGKKSHQKLLVKVLFSLLIAFEEKHLN